MSELESELRQFFEAMSGDDAAAGADLFHDPFLSLDPNTVAVVGVEQLRAALPARQSLFASVGAARPELRDVHATALDDRHALARTTWTMAVGDPEAEPIGLESTYLLRRDGTKWTIVVYLNHNDVAQLIGSRR